MQPEPQSEELLPIRSLSRSASLNEHHVRHETDDIHTPERLSLVSSVEEHSQQAKSFVEPNAEDQDSQNNERTTPPIWRLLVNVFLWEILAMILATGLLLAIILILTNYNHQPQPTWYKVSLNSIISWLSTIAKGCVLFSISEGLGQLKWVWFIQKERPMSNLRTFDSASRGLYGSAELIWNLRARHFAVLGSFAVILALAFDPFTQNLIHYYPKLVNDLSQTAILSKSSVYDAIGPTTSVFYFAEPDMKGNVYNAVFSSASSQPWSTPQFTCSSGNCTWDPVATLAMTSSCTNITDQLKLRCGSGNSSADSSLSMNCTFSLEDSISVNFIPGTVTGTPITIGSNFTSGSVRLIAPDRILAKGLESGGYSTQEQWQAFECEIHPVVRSFRASVVGGVYHEELLGVWHNGTISKGKSTPGWYHLKPDWGSEMGLEDTKDFWIKNVAWATMMHFFSNLFAGETRTGPLGFKFVPGAGSQYASMDVMQAISLSNITGCTAKSAEKLRCAVDNVAAAMSKSFRDTALSTQAGSNVTGKAMVSKTYVAIHWQWIALPALVWLLGITTLVGTVWKTRRTESPIWKNDILPLLFLHENDEINMTESAEAWTGQQKLRLYDGSGGMRLSGP